MHIADGFLSPQVWAPMWAVSACILAFSLKKTKGSLGDRQAPLMGVLSAFVFAAQTLNVFVAAGTSGHVLGGVLASVFLGPWAGSIVMASVFIVQAVVFQDGGITCLGANMFNMGFIGTIGGFYAYRLLWRILGRGNRALAAGAAGWLALVAASAATALEIGYSGVAPLGVLLVALVSVHALIGLLEAAVTWGVVGYVMRVRPDLLDASGVRR